MTSFCSIEKINRFHQIKPSFHTKVIVISFDVCNYILMIDFCENATFLILLFIVSEV
jgi:hypothetical protein